VVNKDYQWKKLHRISYTFRIRKYTCRGE